MSHIKSKKPTLQIMPSVKSSNEIVEWIEQRNGKKRATLIANLVKYLIDNGYDGVDVDLEGKYITPNWENFILETKTELDKVKKKKMWIAAALTGLPQKNTTAAGMKALDWINVMSYDAKGVWDPADPGSHSPISQMTYGLNYFKNLDIPAWRLAFGIPAYGYWFGDDKKTAGDFGFATVVNTDPAYADVDEFTEPERPERTYYYTGRATVRRKVQIARDSNTNITIFRLGTDAMDEYSILKEVGRSMDELGMKLD